MTHFTPISLLLRWLVALFGVFATYNPSGYSYYQWLQHDGGYVSLRGPGWRSRWRSSTWSICARRCVRSDRSASG